MNVRIPDSNRQDSLFEGQVKGRQIGLCRKCSDLQLRLVLAYVARCILWLLGMHEPHIRVSFPKDFLSSATWPNAD